MLARLFLFLSIISQPFSYTIDDVRKEYDALPPLHPMYPLGVEDAPFGNPPNDALMYPHQQYPLSPGEYHYYGDFPPPEGYEHYPPRRRQTKSSKRRRKKDKKKERQYVQFEEEALQNLDNAKFLAGLIRANFWQLESAGGEFGPIRSTIIQCVKEAVEGNDNADILNRLTRAIDEAFLRSTIAEDTLYYLMGEDLIGVLPRVAADGRTMLNRLIPTEDGQAAMAILEGSFWKCADRQSEIAEGVGQRRQIDIRMNPI